MLNHSPVQHSCGNIPPTTFLLQGIETLEDDTFPVGETVFHVWEIVTRVTVVHVPFSPTVLTYFCRLSFNVLPNGLPYKVHPRQVQALLPIDSLYQFV